ncbi:lipid-A-disaccharide synthase [Methylogaea oryzae]|uniref:Lipid-A-disaccharide synthase n=1 Tax=Methylogaea oryzae TaxID=1295382 RepID=A0A8D4VNI6_9GAMM|nr:lipid-A-disaccharide synthase [Methylogaea oryzae]BBL71468.1 lipid-A-disaccharide synthase [Methylogaea oryzae]
MLKRVRTKVMLVAGEASGDLHAANLFRELQKLVPGVKGVGMGGEHMREAGIDVRFDASNMGVIGLFEVLTHYREIHQALAMMKNIARTEKPDLLICVDYKSFNFQLAKAAKAYGVKVMFYVSPQVWAWKPWRVKDYGEIADMMAVIFPFEVPIYEAHNYPVRYVGHPLAGKVKPSVSKAAAMAEFGLSAQAPVVGLLPGSRRGEIKRLLPVMLQAAQLLAERMPGVQFVLPQAGTIKDDSISRHLQDSPVPVKVAQGRTYDVLQCCDAVATCSGTATLETALMGVPMAIVYKLFEPSYWLGRMLVQVPHIGLPNIIAGRGIVPELIQHAANPPAIADALERMLKDKDYAADMRRDLAEIKAELGEDGGSLAMAKLAAELLHRPA